MERIDWIDYGKAIAIYLVILAHTALCEQAEAFIYTFHMPFFFFVSGYLFSYDRHRSFVPFLARRFKQLIIPYIIMNAITYAAWFFVLRKVGSDAGEGVCFLSPITAAITVNAREMLHNVPLWFLAALFIVEIAYYPLYRNKRCRTAITATLLAIAVLNSTLNTMRLPFCIDIAVVAIIFYRIGNQLREKEEKIFNVYTFMLSLAITILAYMLNGKVSMHINYYNNILLFLIGGIAGSYSLSYICYMLQKYLGASRLARIVAKNTLPICAIHLLTFALLKGVMLYILHIDPIALQGTLLPNMFFALLSLTICVPISLLLNRCIPFLSGRR